MSARNGRHRAGLPLWGVKRCPCAGCELERKRARAASQRAYRDRQRARGVRFVHGYAVAPGEVAPTRAELAARARGGAR